MYWGYNPSMKRRALSVAILLIGACDADDPSPVSDCVAPPVLRIGPLLDAAESHCAIDACTGGEGADYCRFWLPFDALVTAQLAVEPQACLDALTARLTCLTSTSCAGGCDAEVAAAEAPCELSTAPNVPEPFDGARTGCVRQADCFTTPGDDEYDLEIAECLAEQGARVWLADDASEPSCGCELQAFLSCLDGADLTCDPTAREEDIACPDESAALQLCTTGWSCVMLGGGGGPSSCDEAASCSGTLYEVSCTEGDCSCTVDGSPGPALTASSCEQAAFRECGAP